VGVIVAVGVDVAVAVGVAVAVAVGVALGVTVGVVVGLAVGVGVGVEVAACVTTMQAENSDVSPVTGAWQSPSPARRPRRRPAPLR